MWKGTEDPGDPPEGGSSDPPSQGHELQDLKDQFEQQQMLITQLKEIIKKTDQTATTVTQEKVAEYANTLTKMKSRAKRHSMGKEKEGDEGSKLSTPASEKVLLLRQQMEQNKVKLAERGKSQKGIEDMVAQVKAQLDDSQQQINLTQTPLNISLFEDRVDYSPQLSSQELYNILLNKDKHISEMNNKISKLQANVMDLQENLKEKDSVIDARTKAITLMSENLSKKGKTTLDALEDTKQQMRTMQANFIEVEEQLKAENASLQSELLSKSQELQTVQRQNEELTMQNSELEQTRTVLQTKITELEAKSSPNSSPSRRSPSKSRKSKKGKFPSKSDKADDENIALITDLEKQLAEKAQQFEKKLEEIELLKAEHLQKVEADEKIIIELKEKETQLLSQIQEKQMEILKLNDITVTDYSASGDGEINKFKQQLDEANKNMIKVKAQHKSKVKELNKKIDAFKKISDANTELVKLENENSKLQLKIAELEEEKGQMQLTMVDSRESTSLDELEATIKQLTTNLEEHQVTINSQESDNNKYQEELQSLRNKLEQMTNDEVKKELTTIQFEEQFENLEQEKTALQNTIETLEQQITETNTHLEVLRKEKCEIQQKYDNLLQDNAELMDRLEKLSTEKVSSAESIEIVENLTQQEKLELEAYQKSLLPKSSIENLDDSPELNDSVNQLTEETSELLQKIELFTVERREVMEKLELLTEENNQLNLKLKEVENNRDILVETYEQLQTEKEILDRKLEKYGESNEDDSVDEYKSLIQKLKDEVKDLKNKVTTLEEENASNETKIKTTEHDFHNQIEEYKTLIQIQKEEINDLKLKLLSLENDHTSNSSAADKAAEERYLQLIADYEALLEQIKEIREANHNYNEIIEGNKQELIKYSELMEKHTKLNEEHEQLKKDLDNYEEKICDVKKQHNLDIENLKEQSEAKLANLSVALEDYEKELNEKCDVIKHLEYEMKVLNDNKLSIEASLADKLNEVEIIKTEKYQKELENEKLLKEVSKINETLQNANLELKIKELETKNKEQLEKMKKIAANLKKKTLDYKDLEAKYNEITQKQNIEVQQSSQGENDKSEEKIQNLEEQLNSAISELQALKQEYTVKNEEYSALTEQERILKQENSQIKTRNEEITNQLHTYSAQIEDLQNIIREYEAQMNSLNREIDTLRSSDTMRKDEDIRRLNEEMEALIYNSQSSNNALQMKIHEQEMCIESQEQDLQKYKEQVSKLGECLSEVEERRESLERRAIDLGHELQNKESSFIQATENEASLESRLKAVAEMDLIIKQNLMDAQDENNTLKKENETMRGEIDTYKKQMNAYNLQIQEFEKNQELTNAMETQTQELENKCRNLENEIKKVNMDLTTLQSETEKSENELQEQLMRYANERKQLMEQVEISGEEIASLIESKNELQRTVDDLNAKLDQQQLDFEETMNQYHALQQEHKKCLSQLENFEKTVQEQEQHIKQFQDKEDSSPEHLQTLLKQKVHELDIFKSTYVPSPVDFFTDNPTEAKLNKEIQELQEKLKEQQPKDEGYLMKIKELEQDIQQRTESLELNENLLKQLQKDVVEKESSIKVYEEEISHWKSQVDFTRNMIEQLEANNFQTLNRNHELEQEVKDLQEQKQLLQQQVETNKIQNLSENKPQPHWPELSDDPFAFVQNQSSDQGFEDVMVKSQATLAQASNNPGNTQEEILQKVKTLEFMLYNTEQEKEHAQIQCAQLSEELGRLLYEREQQQQMVSPTLGDVKSNVTESQINIETQIVSGNEISLPPRIPYEASKDPEQCTSSQTIAEDICQQKQAYQCNPSAFADDDGWGFDIDEPKLTESAIPCTSASSASLINELQEKIRLLNIEKEANLEELHQANVKSGKLIKKLKEFKAKNEQLVAKIKAKSNDDFGLEDAIQEELKTQIANLEKKLKEAEAESAKEKLERENHLKRIDVLTSANDRFVEMKEKQDIEVLGYQQQNRELQRQLEQVAWSSESNEQVVSTSSNANANSSIHSSSSDNMEAKIQELKDTIQELTLDNEDLQAMLEDQTRLRKEAENRAKSVPTDVVDQAQLQTVLEEKAKLVSVIAMHENDNIAIKAELESLKSNLNSICEERDAKEEELKKTLEKLQDNYKEKTLMEASLLENGIMIDSLKKTIDELNASLSKSQKPEDLQKVNEQLIAYQDELEKMNLELNTERSSVINLEATLTQQEHLMEQSQREFTALQETVEDLQNQKQQLQENNALLEANLNNLRTELEETTQRTSQMQSATNIQETLHEEISNLKEQLQEIPSLKEQLLEIPNLKQQLKESDALKLQLQEMDSLKEQLEEMKALKQQLLDQQSEFDVKLLTTSEQLAQEWAMLVEQRGNDVAESWKLHVDTRENEFMQLEQALRKEIHECEEKCNALVNENNELRRNVDAEIRNEVDRISALQQQISDRQTQIVNLSDTLHKSDADVKRLSEENTNLIKQLHEYEGRINTNSEQLTILLSQQDDKDRMIETLSNQLQCAKDNKTTDALIDTLKSELVAKDNEITQCKNTIDELIKTTEELRKVKAELEDNQVQLNELNKEKERNEKLKLKLEESSLQITTLHGTLQEKEHRLREVENFLQQQQNDEANSKIQLQTNVQELQRQISTYTMQLQENNLHINALNEEIESYKVLNNHAQTKDMEIQRLNNLLEEKTREHEYALENQLLESQAVLSSQTQELDSMKRLLNQTEIARDEIVMSKDAEIEAYKEQLEAVTKQLGEYQTEYSNCQTRLAAVTGLISEYENQIAEYARQMTELNGIIEGQVLKIEELQGDLYDKSRNYDVLVAEMNEPQELKKQVRFDESASSSTSGTSNARREPLEEDPTDPVSRAELDLALYMLHQRDVRCEELTVELLELIGERDTLQLKLSTALREKEEIRSRLPPENTDPITPQATSSGGENPSGGKAKAILLGATGTELATEAKEGQIENQKNLENKLSQLKILGYKKDKTLLDEQDFRRLQQMTLLEHHKNDVSKLPAEAQARLLDASYTLSRDTQSPTKVLLNWFWGKSTPKVNNI